MKNSEEKKGQEQTLNETEVDWEQIYTDPDQINTLDDQKGNNLFHEAAMTGNIELVKYLVENGADITLANREGKTAKQLAMDNQVSIMGRIYNKAASIVGKAEFQDTSEVYDYLDKTEKDLIVAKALAEKDLEIEKLRAELYLAQKTSSETKSVPQDPVTELEEDLKKLNAEFKRLLPEDKEIHLENCSIEEQMEKVKIELDEVLRGIEPSEAKDVNKVHGPGGSFRGRS